MSSAESYIFGTMNPEQLGMNQLVELAMLSDKYDVATALKAIAMHWVATGMRKEFTPDEDSENDRYQWRPQRSRLLLEAYYLRLETLFEQVAFNLVKKEDYIYMPSFPKSIAAKIAGFNEVYGQ